MSSTEISKSDNNDDSEKKASETDNMENIVNETQSGQCSDQISDDENQRHSLRKDENLQNIEATMPSRSRAVKKTLPGKCSVSTPSSQRTRNRMTEKNKNTPDIRLAFHSKQKELANSPADDCDSSAKLAKTYDSNTSRTERIT